MTQETQPPTMDQESFERTIRRVMDPIAKAAADAIAKAWEGTRDMRQCEAGPRIREIPIDLRSAGDSGYVSEVIRAAAMDVAMATPKQMVRLPDLPQVGQLSGHQQSDCGKAWVRWQVWYDGHAAKQQACIQWASDIE